MNALALKARDYQKEAVSAVLNKFKKGGETRQLVVVPTGGGKTIIAAMLVSELRRRTLILAHREEILKQTVDKIKMVTPDVSVGILKADDRSGLDAEVCVASVQTASRPDVLKQLITRDFSFCVVDECHHIMSPSYLRICVALGFLDLDEAKAAIRRKSDEEILEDAKKGRKGRKKKETQVDTEGDGLERQVELPKPPKRLSPKKKKEWLVEWKLKEAERRERERQKREEAVRLAVQKAETQIENWTRKFLGKDIVPGPRTTSDGKERLILGITATDYRLDGRDLHDTLSCLSYSKSILDLIQREYLCDVECIRVTTDMSLSGIRQRHGDFALNELAERVNVDERNAIVVDTYKKYGELKPGVVFCCDVAHSKDMARDFNRSGIRAAAVYGDMPHDERVAVLDAYGRGEIDILTNCNVLTEGWDMPKVEVLMMARPTQSTGLYVQAAGRGLRPAPNKEKCLLIDFVDASNGRDVKDAGVLLGDYGAGRYRDCILEMMTPKDEQKDGGAPTFGAKKYRRFSVLDFCEYVDSGQLDAFLYEREKAQEKERVRHIVEHIEDFSYGYSARKKLHVVWHEHDGTVWTSVLDERIDLSRRDDGNYVAFLCKPKEQSIQQIAGPMPDIQYLIGTCEDWLRTYRTGAKNLIDKDAKWRNDEASEKQVKLIRKMKLELPRGRMYPVFAYKSKKEFNTVAQTGLKVLTKGEASDLIDRGKRVKEKNPATPKQIELIKKNGWHPEPDTLTLASAYALISSKVCSYSSKT